MWKPFGFGHKLQQPYRQDSNLPRLAIEIGVTLYLGLFPATLFNQCQPGWIEKTVELPNKFTQLGDDGLLIIQ
jgi:hypothetical protein